MCFNYWVGKQLDWLILSVAALKVKGNWIRKLAGCGPSFVLFEKLI